MIQIKLDWQGWWLYRTPMSQVPQLEWDHVFIAVLAAKLQKVNGGVGCSHRELVMFQYHKGDKAREFIENMPKTSFGAFVKNRANEINKKAIVYVAKAPDDITEKQAQGALALMYNAVPFAPKHHAMPAPWTGESMHLVNDGKKVGLPPEIFHTDSGKSPADSDKTSDPDADNAMSEAIAKEASITRKMTKDERDPSGIATEKLPKPEPGTMATERVPKPGEDSSNLETEKVSKPTLVETEIVSREDVAQGIATEKVPKPDEIAAESGSE